MKIKIDGVTKRYRNTLAADHVSFSFESGKIYGFVGPNGAGKTTTIKVMSTLVQPDEGDVFFDDISTVLYPELVRRVLGYMPDALPSYKDIQVWEYLDFFARTFGLKGEKRRKRLADIEEFTGLVPLREKIIDGLSKGMKQRVSLARALVSDPEVLVLDEPAAGLDPRARIDLRNLLKILASQGKAILLSSHILSELQDICDGAVIIERGKVLASGSIEEIGKKMSPTSDGTVVPPPLPGETPATPTVPVSLPAEARYLVVTSLGASEAVRTKLLEDPDVLKVEVLTEDEVHVTIRGEDEQVPRKMAPLFAAGLPVTGFHIRKMALEEIFMRITSGEVQ
ncbi:MAG: ATP-binding cassette domain-containing protein [Victivallales bacterium]|nr:ATP-binding cassette domain-containing protein [Victivallales bacterium]